jgi:hypothetical protein
MRLVIYGVRIPISVSEVVISARPASNYRRHRTPILFLSYHKSPPTSHRIPKRLLRTQACRFSISPQSRVQTTDLREHAINHPPQPHQNRQRYEHRPYRNLSPRRRRRPPLRLPFKPRPSIPRRNPPNHHQNVSQLQTLRASPNQPRHALETRPRTLPPIRLSNRHWQQHRNRNLGPPAQRRRGVSEDNPIAFRAGDD